MTPVETILAKLGVTGEGQKRGDATVYRSFCPADRYKYDFELCSGRDGWHQYDTEQDAWYHGVWYHPEAHVFVIYAEGDEIVIVCHTDEAWRAEVFDMSRVYGARLRRRSGSTPRPAP